MTLLPDRGSRLALTLATLLLAAGVVLIAVADGVTAIVGGGLVAVAATIVIALAFYAVGRSEDRDRAAGRA